MTEDTRVLLTPEMVAGLNRKTRPIIVCVILVSIIFSTMLVVWPKYYHPPPVVVPVAEMKNLKLHSAKLLKEIEADNIRENLKTLTTQPLVAGTREGAEAAIWLNDKMKEFGLESNIVPYDVLLSYPVSASIKIQGRQEELNLETDELKPFPNSRAFNAYGATGSCTEGVVYGGYGRTIDWQHVKGSDIAIEGKIGIVRYGKIFRGDKAAIAEKFGLCGLLLYNDPADYKKGDAFPDDMWLPDSGVQRGTIYRGVGDPSTPGWPSNKNADRLSDEEVASVLPKIPVHPITAESADVILGEIASNFNAFPVNRLRGPHMAETDWQGGFGFEYKVGPGPVMTMDIVNNRTVKTIYNVISRLEGEEEQEGDRAVILGNHRDSWVQGAVDPHSGSAALIEVARVLGNLKKEGWKPRRTMILASWDAEEYGLIGSTEWVEDNEVQLSAQAVAYINLDSALGGIDSFNVRASPPLAEMLIKAAKDINVDGATLYDMWKKAESNSGTYEVSSSDPPVGMLGSGSDFCAFSHHLGIDSADFSFRGKRPYPVYHSRFDSFEWYEKFGDRDFEYSAVMARFVVLVFYRLANEPVLPFTFAPYTSVLNQGITTLKEKLQQRLGEELAMGLDKQIALLEGAVDDFTGAILAWRDSFHSLEGKKALGFGAGSSSERQMNDRLMLVERAFLSGPGLSSRPWYKHLIFAPQMENQYQGAIFPGVIDALNAAGQNGQDIPAETIAKELSGPIRTAAMAVYNAKKFLIHPLGAGTEESE